MEPTPSESEVKHFHQNSLVDQAREVSEKNHQSCNSACDQLSCSSSNMMDACTSANSESTKIQTFVFFDLETSGVSGYDCRILELSMVAVSREDLLDMKKSIRISDVIRNLDKTKVTVGHSHQPLSPVPKLPRVLHKYSRLYYPRKIIHPIIEEITGLSNDLLHRLTGFSSKSADALNLFLDLPKPITLVAHNGNRFDFPLLKAELGNVLNGEDMKHFRDLLCTDSLLAFREIEGNMKVDQEYKEIMEISALAESFSLEDMDEEELMAFEPERKKARCTKDEASRRVSTPPSPGNEGDLVISLDLPVTPLKEQPIVTNPPQTPMKAKIPPKLPITPDSNANSDKANGVNDVRRSLTYGIQKRKWDGTQPFKQVNLYKRLFGTQYDAHRAEADCIALLEICGFYSQKFVDWADKHCTKFSTVKPMWEKRKTFKY